MRSLEPLTFHSLELQPVRIPLKRPIVSRVGSYADWPVVAITLRTSEGVSGCSYLEPYLAHSMKYIVSIMSDLAVAKQGKRITPLSDFQADRKSLSLIGYEGLAMIAVAGLDMAAWDALAKAANLPLARLLGGDIGAVPAYNSNGLWLTDIANLADEALALVAEGGFDAIKLRLGRDRLQQDIDAIEAVRDAVGSDIKIMVDFNQGLRFGDAVRRCHELDDFGLYWFEEPIAYDNIDGYADLAAGLKTPLCLGENFYGPRALSRAVMAKAGTFMMPDMMRIGGVSGWLRSVPIAGALGIDVSSHLYPEASAHLLRITETGHWLEWQDWVNPILQAPFELEDGSIHIPDRPGTGVEFDRDALARFAFE
ncbi:mandelate racemase/muconate lactonizing protein [Caballeronia fortuita]|uniref:Mandelate racemase/muconate lactonizing protein n=1 Tax=Caballeronia fortuita TaxID=1777138 RepID=A0A157ZQQ2_9BURK|nr:enolase C-terminal domain-like protein [Caballeronia fortuita]SAK47287.1 mandelate racemase/muconate lactonizing protein [Caballeronia fortuita]